MPHSEDEDDKDIMDENSEEMKKFNNRVSVVKNRIAISGEVFNANSAKNFIAPVYDKTIDQNNRIEKSLKKNFIFNSLKMTGGLLNGLSFLGYLLTVGILIIKHQIYEKNYKIRKPYKIKWCIFINNNFTSSL